MPNVMTVTLKNNPAVLDVNETGNGNEVGKSPTEQNLSWQLTGNAAQGSFVPMDAAEPGFEWVQTPPAGIFGTPQISNNGNQLSLTDLNNSPSTTGSWIYRLRATIGGVVYSTETSTPTGVTTDPRIKNN